MPAGMDNGLIPFKFTTDDGLYALQQAIMHWGVLADGLPIRTATSVLQKVLFQGNPAFLKIALCDEEYQGIKVLRWWNGQGAVQVLASHDNAVLLEYAGGSRSLAAMSRTGEDSEASRIMCKVAAQLHRQPDAYLPELMPLSQRFDALRVAASGMGGIFQKLANIADNLLMTPRNKVVLHGDLHHDNVLDAGIRGWLAIDPKGIFGERDFDFANLFCNPDYPIATQPGRFEQQLKVVADAAELDCQRLLKWIAAWAGLSATWHIEAGGKPDTALAVAALSLSHLTN